MDIPNGAYWKVITLHIEYIFKMPIEWKDAYWMKDVYWLKRCLLNENVSIDRKCAYWLDIPKGIYCKFITFYFGYILNVHIERKCAYWPKMCLLNKKVPIDQKNVYWMKMYLLTENVHFEWK